MRYRLVATCHKSKTVSRDRKPGPHWLSTFELDSHFWPLNTADAPASERGGGRSRQSHPEDAGATSGGRAPAAGALFVGNTHFLDHAGTSGEWLPRPGAEFLGGAAAPRI